MNSIENRINQSGGFIVIVDDILKDDKITSEEIRRQSL